MAAPQITLVDPKVFKYDDRIEIAAGETQIIINLPAAVPVGKKGVARISIRAQLVDAE